MVDGSDCLPGLIRLGSLLDRKVVKVEVEVGVKLKVEVEVDEVV